MAPSRTTKPIRETISSGQLQAYRVKAEQANASLRLAFLKLLYNVGSNGMMQKHIFQRAPKSSTARRINALAAMREQGFITRQTSDRHTESWGYLWTITQAGIAAYAASQVPAAAKSPAGFSIAPPAATVTTR